MLSDKDILKAIEQKDLVIDPFDPACVRPSAISLKLGAEILIPKKVDLIDIRKKTDLPYETVKISTDKPFILRPQQFVLGHTFEKVSVSTKLGFLIEGRSTLARLGVSVVQSAMIVDSGHTGRPITLEIFNCGPSPITLYAGMSISKAVVFRLSSTANRSYDKYARYSNQSSGVGKPILREVSQ